MSEYGDIAESYFAGDTIAARAWSPRLCPFWAWTRRAALRAASGWRRRGAYAGGVRRLLGLTMVIGMVYADPADPQDKSRIYGIVQELAQQYRAQNGGNSIVCRELLGLAAPENSAQAQPRTANTTAGAPARSWCTLRRI